MERQKHNYGAEKPERGRSPYKKKEGYSSKNRNFDSRENRTAKPYHDRDESYERSNRDENGSRPRRNFGGNNQDKDPRNYNDHRQEKPRKVIRLKRDFDSSRKDFDHPREERRNDYRPSSERHSDRRKGYNNKSDERNNRNNNTNRRERTYRRQDEDFFEIRGNSHGYDDIQLGKDGLIRLNKYISNSGICSRREADELIKVGAVTVNGEVVTEMGYKVSIDDVIVYGGERLVNERKKYLLLNKPKGYITTLEDPRDRKTVMSLIHKACKERLYPVGRLDRNTTGLLLFTNDGQMTKKLTHPSFGAKKIYHVELDKALTHADMQQIIDGIELEDGRIAADDIQYVGDGEDKKMIGIELHSGKNRIVRRIFASLGYEVYKLDRVAFASLTKKNLPRGTYRFLTDKEVAFLKMLKTN